jgi:CheY-like chemotaxis protein
MPNGSGCRITSSSGIRSTVIDEDGFAAHQAVHRSFERFRQADGSTTRAHGGIGLGLAITRHLVERHGGSIEASSAGAGTGATFRVRLPVMIVHPTTYDEPRVHPREAHGRPSMPIPDLKGVHVVVVDDDADSLTLVREILEATGAAVVTAGSGAAALEILQQLDADLLLADLGMPAMDGFELVAQLRKSNSSRLRSLPAAALTAYARSEDRARALRLGFQMHLAKPIDPAELMAAVAALTNRNMPE